MRPGAGQQGLRGLVELTAVAEPGQRILARQAGELRDQAVVAHQHEGERGGRRSEAEEQVEKELLRGEGIGRRHRVFAMQHEHGHTQERGEPRGREDPAHHQPVADPHLRGSAQSRAGAGQEQDRDGQGVERKPQETRRPDQPEHHTYGEHRGDDRRERNHRLAKAGEATQRPHAFGHPEREQGVRADQRDGIRPVVAIGEEQPPERKDRDTPLPCLRGLAQERRASR